MTDDVQGDTVERQNQTVSRNNWVRGGILLTLSVLLFASGQSLYQVTFFPYFSVVADLLLLVAFWYFLRDAGKPGAMLADRRIACTSLIVLAISLIARPFVDQALVTQGFTNPGSPLPFAAAHVLVEGAGLVALGAFAWLVHKSPRVYRTYKTIIVWAIIVTIVLLVIEELFMATSIAAMNVPMLTYTIVASATWLIHVFGMLAIAFAAILAVHHEASLWVTAEAEPLGTVSAPDPHEG